VSLADARVARGPAADAAMLAALIGTSPDGRLRSLYIETPVDDRQTVARLRRDIAAKDEALRVAETLLGESADLLDRYNAAIWQNEEAVA